MKSVFKTDKGKVRFHNEDSGGVFPHSRRLLAVVADGMGGHRAGDVASQMAIKFIQEKWEDVEGLQEQNDDGKWLNDVILAANKHLFNHSNQNEECRGMGTTIVAAICQKDVFVIGHVGDSRIYFLPAEGDFLQVTEDHTLVNEFVKSGQLSKEDAELHPQKHVIMRALGTEQDIEVDTKTIKWARGAKILLCSDGLSNKLSDEELNSILSSGQTLDEQASLMIEKANAAGGDDNITVTIIENTDGDDS
ncbi:protein phosphatase [Scopulibacillus darangshiensis]|uniref:protein-serine/threonine phosphatase n=1 Tax=Scopulibacillus darangshiensis TaxID=442528 RepID=A0A4R2P596_9BACL|nr:Stp1/IreP family PP2C-type Ser/Thr phosphatase [Scopulibacillus darangshiensis]TCP29131.1 protein phosphatase [Scopulibacillus darangshiensis]